MMLFVLIWNRLFPPAEPSKPDKIDDLVATMLTNKTDAFLADDLAVMKATTSSLKNRRINAMKKLKRNNKVRCVFL